MKRPFKAIAAVMVLLLAAAGIRWGASQPSEPPTVAPEPLTLRIAWWGGDYRNEATIKVIHRYERLNPHIKIEYDYSAFNEYWKKLAPLAAGNVLPDIVQMDVSYLYEYMSHGLLADLQPFVERGLIDSSDIPDALLAGGRGAEGGLYGFSLGTNALFAAYDPAVLLSLGLERPTADWTWDSFAGMGQAIQGKGVYLSLDLTPEQFFAYYLRQHGRSLYSSDGKSLGYEDDRLFVGFFARLQKLAKAKLMTLPNIWNHEAMKENNPFVEGKALFYWGYSNQFMALDEDSKSELAIAPMPGPDSSKGLFLKPGMFFSIAESSTHKAEAARFIDFFIHDLESNLILNGERGVPVSAAVKEGMLPHINPALAKVFAYVDWVQANSSPMDPPDPPGAAEVTAALRELNDQLLFQRIEPAAAASEFRRRAERILGAR
ncbi:extracellular solute-binding protein [Paenibacillus sp. FSL W8-1187]|uniref:ABC transporter substrate-binding protein n=1 Tax=Paenibacillus sp. FSL W8-1187 TaxID=2975339 RepID=UPI0030D948E4